MWLLIIMLHVNAGVNLTLYDFKNQNDCLQVLQIIEKTAKGSGILGNLEHGECKQITPPNSY